MPFLSIFRKDQSRSPAPTSPTTSRKSSSFSRGKSRQSLSSSRAASPPPQLANISPQSDLDYVLPELDEIDLKRAEAEPESARRRGLLRRRRESAGPISPTTTTVPASPTTTTSPPRPFSEVLELMAARDPDRDRPCGSNNAINNNNLNSNDSDDDPLVPPPPRASVFQGFTYSDQDRRSQSLPDDRPVRPQAHPHQQNLSSSTSSTSDMKSKKGRPSGGLFGWRTKSSKEPVAPPEDVSFSLKSFRHVGPAPEATDPVSPTNITSPNTTTPPTATTPPSSFRAKSPETTPTARAVPGRSAPVTRERVNSTSSEGMMTAGLFRQAARRSSTNLVEDVAEPPKPRSRDNERRGPPTRPWERDDAGAASSGSERPPRSIRPRPSAADSEDMGTRVVSRSSSAIPYVGPRKSMAIDDDDSTPESPSPFAGRLGDSGRESPFGSRSDYGRGDFSHIPRVDYSMYGARSDGALRTVRPGPRPSSPAKLGSPSSPTKPSVLAGSSILSSSPPRLSLGLGSPPSPTSPKQGPPPSKRPSSPTKPRHSAPTNRATRSPIRTTIPTKTNDGPSIKPGQAPKPYRPGSPAKPSTGMGHGRKPSGDVSVRSISVDVSAHSRRPSGFEVVSRPKSPGPASGLVHARNGTIDLNSHSRSGTIDLNNSTEFARPKTPGGGDVARAKSPTPTVESSRAKSPTPSAHSIRAQAPMRTPASTTNTRAPGPAPATNTRAPGPAPARASPPSTAARTSPPAANTRTSPPTTARANQAVPRAGYVPPPRQSSLARTTLVDSDSDESPEETESGSDEVGYGGKKAETKKVVGGPGMKGKPGILKRTDSDEQGLSRERTITQRDRASPAPPADAKPSAAPPRIGVSLFDKPMPKFDEEPVERPAVKFDTPTRGFARTRASHSTSAISEAAKARNSAAMAEANRAMAGKHSRAGSFGAGEAMRTSHIRAPAVGTDTDEDEEDEEKSDSESDDAPLSSLAPARRPGSAASTAPPMTRTPAARPAPGPRPSLPTPASGPRPSFGAGPRPSLGPPLSRSAKPLIDMSGVPAPPKPAPPARSARRVPGVGVTRNSSLRGSRSVEDLGRVIMAKSVVGVGRPGPRPFVASPPSSTGDSSSGKAPLTPRDGSEAGGQRSAEARRKERRRSEAKASVDLANVINGPGPADDDDDDMSSAHHSQMGHGMGMMGWNGSGFFPQGGFPGFPASQSMPFLHPQMSGPPPMGFMPPPPPPGANEAYMAAHQQAMMIAKQTYLSAVAQQAMAAATEQWERSSTVGGGGSVYGGSQMGGMMGMPMMGMYASSAYAASSYEPSVVGGWGSASAYGGPARSVYGGGPARSEYGGGMRNTSPTKSAATARNEGHGRTRSRTHTTPSDTPQPTSNRASPVPPSTWNTRRKAI